MFDEEGHEESRVNWGPGYPDQPKLSAFLAERLDLPQAEAEEIARNTTAAWNAQPKTDTALNFGFAVFLPTVFGLAVAGALAFIACLVLLTLEFPEYGFGVIAAVVIIALLLFLGWRRRIAADRAASSS